MLCADVICQKGKLMKKWINIEEGDSFTFKTQASKKYSKNTKCHVTYKVN